jgi:hypothetical protein
MLAVSQIYGRGANMGEEVTGNITVVKVPSTQAGTAGKPKKKKVQIKLGKGKVYVKGRTNAKGRNAFMAAVKKAARTYIK